jgi:hypothetical protein
MKSTVVKRSIAIAGHKTSISLEDAFWRGPKEIAKQAGYQLPIKSIPDVITAISRRLYDGLCSIMPGVPKRDHSHDSQARSPHR